MSAVMVRVQKPFWPRHWFAVVLAALLLYVATPFLAPLLMHIGWSGPGRAIYLIYSFLCHQLPERSYFLFGTQSTYPLGQIQQAAGVTEAGNLFALRQFIGNTGMGWKVAWSDRMVWMFGSIPLFALAWYPFRKRIACLPLWGLALLLLPMALDGGTHLVSDLQGLGIGFRHTNLWLAVLTNSAYPLAFYAGDAWGSFNSMMRLTTGLLFGLGFVWFGFPYLEQAFSKGVLK